MSNANMDGYTDVCSSSMVLSHVIADPAMDPEPVEAGVVRMSMVVVDIKLDYMPVTL